MPKNQRNQYTCQKCGGTVVTLDVDEGTTPFTIPCLATDGCGGDMFSSWYKVAKGVKHEYEWFKPKDLSAYPPEMLDHFKQGGLDLRKVGPDEPLDWERLLNRIP